MSAPNPIGIRRLASITWYVRDLARKRRFFVQTLGFREACDATVEGNEAGQESLVFQAGACRIVCCAPTHDSSAAARFLRLHPEGIGRLTFEVDSIAQARRCLLDREATLVSDDRVGADRSLVVATPIDDLFFCFVHGERCAPTRGSGRGSGPTQFDHVTINTGTVLPTALWLQEVLGFEPYWRTEFHTSDGLDPSPPQGQPGSGLKSVVLSEPDSGVKFALNEPKPPNAEISQIELFRQDHRGSGVQHVALHVDHIVDFVATLRSRGVRFAATPPAYYDQLESRLVRIGVGTIDEPIGSLRELGILVDGSGPGRYLLQIFVEDDAAFLGGGDRSPFFLELIERKGCTEFGAGNFRALFESIAAAQAVRIDGSTGPSKGRGA